jgi:putative oxidoreductase
MTLGLLVLRIVVGALFVGHGAQKLLGFFGGHSLDGTGAFFESLGLRRRSACPCGPDASV